MLKAKEILEQELAFKYYNKKYTQELKDALKEIDNLIARAVTAETKLAYEKARVRELEAVLKWYGDEENFYARKWDRGQRAREVCGETD